jgi:hypothetical protein
MLLDMLSLVEWEIVVLSMMLVGIIYQVQHLHHLLVIMLE